MLRGPGLQKDCYDLSVAGNPMEGEIGGPESIKRETNTKGHELVSARAYKCT